MEMTQDPKRLQAALDKALDDLIAAQFGALIGALVEAPRKQEPDEPIKHLTAPEACENFTKMVRLIWDTYNHFSPLDDFIKDS